jgi:hypothetical protein
MKKENSESASAEKHDLDFERSIDELVLAIVEGLREHHRSDVEPFEVYTQRIRAKIHSNANLFRSRFSRGYHTLLEELKKDNSKYKGPLNGGNTIKP